MDNEIGNLSIFNKIYAKSFWGNGSGEGSSPEATVPYKHFIEDFINKNNISSVVDLGCGDWQFSQFMDFKGAKYLGIDASENIIDINSKKFSNKKVSFMHLPDSYEKIPKADLLLCKDVMQHLNIQEIFKISKIFPRYKFCLITNDVLNASPLGKAIIRILNKRWKLVNREIQIGDYRPLELTQKPFCFKLNKVFEWRVFPYSYPQKFYWKNLILGKNCGFRKRIDLYKQEH